MVAVRGVERQGQPHARLSCGLPFGRHWASLRCPFDADKGGRGPGGVGAPGGGRCPPDTFADAVSGLGRVLDVGCGPGTVTAYLAERGLDVSGVDLSPHMIENACRLHPQCRFGVAPATDLVLGEASFGGVLGWWSLFHLPRDVLPQVLSLFAGALKPGGHFITGTHVGDEDAARTEAYGGVPVRWTTYKWRPEQLVDLIEQAGLRPVAELRLPAEEYSGPSVVVMARRPD